MAWDSWGAVILIIDTVIRIVAIGTIPENRRPSSSIAWLLLILSVPLLGTLLYALIGSPYVRGRRRRDQDAATKLISEAAAQLPPIPPGVSAGTTLSSIMGMNQRLSGMPVVMGNDVELFDDTKALYHAMAEAVSTAQLRVHFEFYCATWDETTRELIEALIAVAQRGVPVRFMMDHIGSQKYPGYKELQRRLTAAGIDWHLMMPILPLQGKFRRPDLRNHRKILTVDSTIGFVGSHNVIDPSYDKPRNKKIGRAWHDLSVQVTGPIVAELEAVFATDWFIETGNQIADEIDLMGRARGHLDPSPQARELPAGPGGAITVGQAVPEAHIAPPNADLVLERQPPDEAKPLSAMQIVPSGPGFATAPNLRMFTALIHMATKHAMICSPYFVPDEAMVNAITSASLRGVRIDLYVGEEADQFVVGHAQRSYYEMLLEAGVHIWLYPKPAVLHTKFLVVDDEVGVIGSSNMDIRSFLLDYEVSMMVFGGDLVMGLHNEGKKYEDASRELTLAEWKAQPWYSRYVDNVCRLVSALM